MNRPDRTGTCLEEKQIGPMPWWEQIVGMGAVALLVDFGGGRVGLVPGLVRHAMDAWMTAFQRPF